MRGAVIASVALEQGRHVQRSRLIRALRGAA